MTSLTEKIDPIKLNQTLTAATEALSGLGSRFGRSLEDANAILDDLNPRLPRLRQDLIRAAGFADTAVVDYLWGRQLGLYTINP